MQRRNFLKSLALSPVIISSLSVTQNTNTIKNNEFLGKASIIDLDKCDGCKTLLPRKVYEGYLKK